MLYTIKYYESKNGKRPFESWLEEQDLSIQALIIAKLERVSLGNFSTCKSLGRSLSEIKIDVGPGYRIYYSMSGRTLLLLLCAGTKRTQTKDIEKAEAYLQDYKEREQRYGKK